LASIINASNSGFGGIVSTGDSSGQLQLQTAGTTALTIDTSQRAAFVAGTAAAPAITTTGDTNTGMFFPAADTIAFAEGGTEAMRLDSSGNVGIGTTTVASGRKFQVEASGDTIQRINSGGASSGLGVEFANNGTLRGGIGNGSGNISGGSATTFAVQAVNELVFASGGYSERMRIDSSGNLLVGTTSANGRLTVSSSTSDAVAATIANTSASPYGLLTDFTSDPNNATNYGYKFRLTNNTNIYTIFSNGTTSARSDERFKKDIETTRDGYAEDLSKLRVVKYRWHNAEENSPKELGFIAQEVEQVFPNLISTEMNDDGVDVKSIKTSVFVPMLVKAIQEQQTIINDLKARVETLEAK